MKRWHATSSTFYDLEGRLDALSREGWDIQYIFYDPVKTVEERRYAGRDSFVIVASRQERDR